MIEPIETLQLITLGFVGFVWVEIRNLRELLSSAREQASAHGARIEGLEETLRAVIAKDAK